MIFNSPENQPGIYFRRMENNAAFKNEDRQGSDLRKRDLDHGVICRTSGALQSAADPL